jgi:hypothetical protein
MAKLVDKPVRLYALTIFILVAYGLFPLVSVFPMGRDLWLIGPRFLPFNGSILALYGRDGDISIIQLVVTVSLSFVSLGSTIVAFYGVAEGRTAALIFLTLNLAWWFLLVITSITYSEGAPDRIIPLVGQLVFPPIWLAGVWWNFTRPDISAWLKYMSEVNAQKD